MPKKLILSIFRAAIIVSFLINARFALADISGEWNFYLNVQGQSGSAVAPFGKMMRILKELMSDSGLERLILPAL